MLFIQRRKALFAFSWLKFFSAVNNLSSKRSAIAMMLVLVFAEMDDVTAVPRFPQPITPSRIAEFAFEPKTIPGFKIENAEMVAVFLRNVLLCMVVIRCLDKKETVHMKNW
jgi:hypothetical protein